MISNEGALMAVNDGLSLRIDKGLYVGKTGMAVGISPGSPYDYLRLDVGGEVISVSTKDVSWS